MKLNNDTVMFTGGGTGGHIYPGLAVADTVKQIAKESNRSVKICWIGCSKGMDKKIVEKATGPDSLPTADKFYGIPSGKLRRYFSLRNFTDAFRIVAGYFAARRILRKEKPAVLFSKGGFVSVPPCLAAKHLGIPVFTHECDFTLGLANRLNFKSAKTMFVSYEETKNRLSPADQTRVVVTGNPVRPVFYNTNANRGREFLNLSKTNAAALDNSNATNNSNAGDNSVTKPILLVLGGSSGARQINQLVTENLDFLCQHFTVVHQTGLVNGNEETERSLKEKYGDAYKPYNFIYEQMPDVVSAADVILSRAGANSLSEAAVLGKPLVLIPLCGNGTRGDQVDNSKFFQENGAAEVLIGPDANSENLKSALTKMLDSKVRQEYKSALEKLTGNEKPAEKIARIILKEAWGE